MTLRRHDRHAYPPIPHARLTPHQTKLIEFGDLPTDRRIVATDPVGEIDHTDRPEPLDAYSCTPSAAIKRAP